MSVDVHIGIYTKANFTKKERFDLYNQLQKDIQTYVQLRMSDLALKHVKLLDGYELDIFPESND